MSSTTLELKTDDILKNRFSEEEASTLIEFVESKTEQTVNQKKDVFATKEDIHKLETTTKSDIHKLEIALKEDILKLDVKISETKADLIKWMFLFWIGQTAAVLAIVKLL